MGFVGDILGGIGDIFTGVFDFIGEIATFAFNGLKNMFSNPLALLSMGMTLMGIPSPISMIWDGISSMASSIGTGISSFFSDMGLATATETLSGGMGMTIGEMAGSGAIPTAGGGLFEAGAGAGAGTLGADMIPTMATGDVLSGTGMGFLGGSSPGWAMEGMDLNFFDDAGSFLDIGGGLTDFYDWGFDGSLGVNNDGFSGIFGDGGSGIEFSGGTDWMTGGTGIGNNLPFDLNTAFSTAGTPNRLGGIVNQAGTGISAGSSGSKGILGGITDWIEGNPTTAKLLANTVSGGLNNLYAEDLLDLQHKNSVELLQEKARLERELASQVEEDRRANRVSFGVTGTESDTSNRINTEQKLMAINAALASKRSAIEAPRYQAVLNGPANPNYNPGT